MADECVILSAIGILKSPFATDSVRQFHSVVPPVLKSSASCLGGEERMKRTLRSRPRPLIAIFCTLFATVVLGQPVPEPAALEREAGIPITDPLVIAKCGSCHARDDQGNLQRLSWERTTPEGWQDAVK